MAHEGGRHDGSPAALDVRDLPPRLRRGKILEAFEALPPGTALVLVNDHDPKPLFDQLQAERPGAFGWRSLEEGPETWRVVITKGVAPGVGAGDGPGRAPKPPALAALPESRQVPLDVRDDIRRGEEPFGGIMAAVKALAQDQALVLRAPFEPVPLYGVLGRRGLAHWTECRGPGDWVVWVYREPGAARRAAPLAEPAAGTPGAARTVRFDVQGLEPPEPMVRVLERLETLAPGETLEVLHDRRPVFLYPQLDERGFAHETDEPEPGTVRILIRPGPRAG